MRYRLASLGVVVLIGMLLVWVVHGHVQHEREVAQKRFEERMARADAAVERDIEHVFGELYMGMRTIARLPMVRGLGDRGGVESLSDDGLVLIRELCNNLSEHVAVFDLYVVPIGFEPSGGDGGEGQPVFALCGQGEEEGEGDDLTGVHQQVREQLAWFEQHAARVGAEKGCDHPALLSEAVRVSRREPEGAGEVTGGVMGAGEAGGDLGRVYSTPVYGQDGLLRGCVSAVVLESVIERALVSGDYALRLPGGVVWSRWGGGEGKGVAWEHAQDVLAGRTGVGLCCSRVRRLNVVDASGEWVLWSGRAEGVYESSPEVAAAHQMAVLTYGGMGAFLVAMGWAWYTVSRHIGAMGRQRRELEARVTQRTEAIRAIVEGTAGSYDTAFFDHLVKNLCKAVGVRMAFVAEVMDEDWSRAVTVGGWMHGKPAKPIEYALEGTPCEQVVGKKVRTYPERVAELFPEDTMLVDVGAQSYCGAPLFDSQGRAVGVISLIDTEPLRCPEDAESLISVFASRAGAEIERHRMIRALCEQAEALKKSRSEAEQASRAKSMFLANMSHEIRTPMTAILGFAELLTERGHSEDERLAWGLTIKRQGEHLLMIINDILDFSKIEAGQMNIEFSQADPLQVMEDVASLLGVRAREKGIRLTTEVVGHVPERMQTDPLRLRQILLNLAGNAIKFTERGGVRLVLRHVSHEGRSKVIFEVADTGIGMSEGQAGKLFVPFTQVDESATRKFGGTGLGLAISRQLACLLGGRLDATSTLGMGSVFALELGAGATENLVLSKRRSSVAVGNEWSGQDKKGKGKELDGVRVLLVEDSVENQRLIAFRLRRAGAVIQIVQDGQQALDATGYGRESEHDAGQAFDLVLMDMQMPVMDGYTAAQTLRQRGFTTPIVALTAHAMSGDREKCLKAGCNDYATKPINRDALIAVCAKWVEADPERRRAA